MKIYLLVGILLLSSCASAVKSENYNVAEVCSEGELRAIKNLYDKSAEDSAKYAVQAYSVGKEIQDAVADKNIERIISFFEGELENGPRKAFLVGKEFDEVFSEEWRQAVLAEKPPCSPIGWRGFMLGPGYIWYKATKDEHRRIFSINGAVDEIPEEQRKAEWIYEGQVLEGSCFTTISIRGDKYRHFHETFAKADDEDDFNRNIGKYFGDKVPLGSSPFHWLDGEETPEVIYSSLAVKMSACMAPVDDETRDINDDIYGKTYQVLRDLPSKLCKTLAPGLSQGCEEIKLVTVTGPLGYSNVDVDTVLYGIAKELDTGGAYVVPLVNFENQNDALNYLDTVE